MKKFTVALVVFILLVFCRFTSSTLTLCEKIKQKTPKLTTYSFTDELLFKLNRKNLFLIDSTFSAELFPQETLSDSLFALGWFDVSPTRLGFVYCNTTFEGDQRVAFIGLYIIDNCDKVVYENNYLATTDDDNPNYYDLNAELSVDKKMLTTVYKHTSEWVGVNEGREKDTLFTETYKIDLSSAKIDTVYRNVTFKPMKE